MDPPWAGIDFVFAIGSDELADQLRAAYPQGKNLRERKHMAAIDFLKTELEKMGAASESAQSPGSPLDTSNEYRDTRGHTRHDIQASQSFVSYPHSAVSQASPSVSSSLDSPRIRERARQANTDSGKPSENASVVSTVPVVSAQTFVFSAMDGKPVQTRSKKTMSNQERQEYRKTRQRGACAKCRRTKAKVFEIPWIVSC